MTREPRVQRGPRGALILRRLPPLWTVALLALPALLKDDGPGVRGRLYPAPFPEDDGERNDEWRRHAVPELEHLFASAREIVVKDLRERLRPEEPGKGGAPADGDAYRLSIAAKRFPAWMSALSAARVVLGEIHGVTAADMDGPIPEDLPTERDRAVLLIQVLGWIQGLLLEGPRPA